MSKYIYLVELDSGLHATEIAEALKSAGMECRVSNSQPAAYSKSLVGHIYNWHLEVSRQEAPLVLRTIVKSLQ